MSTRKVIRKTLASVRKRFHILAGSGYSVGSAYGARFLLDWRHSLDKKVALQLYEHDQITALLKVFNQIRPDLFVDIGSHAGLYSIVLKTHHPGLEVHAFEPDRTNLCQLYGNLFVNRMAEAIHVHEYGLSDRAGSVRFDAAEVSSSRATRRISSTGNMEIQVRRLDDVLSPRDRTIVMKIDVEGHENEVVAGALQLLGANRCFLQVESSGDRLVRVRKRLEGLGYAWIRQLGVQDHFFTNIASLQGNPPVVENLA